MKKYYYLATLLACTLSGSAVAQSVDFRPSLQQSSPEWVKNNPNNHFVKSEAPESGLKTKKHFARPALETAPRVINPLSNEKVMPVDTMLCVEHTQTVDNINTFTKKYDYDRYGFYKMTLKDSADVHEAMQYKYVVGNQGYWISRIIEQKMPDGTLKKISKMERDINDRNELVGLRVYNVDKEKNEFWLANERKYNYDHLDEWAGAEVYFCDYTSDGKVERKTTYTWYEGEHRYIKMDDIYIRNGYIDKYQTGEQTDNAFIIKHYNKKADGTFYISLIEDYYFDGDGYVNNTFDEDGKSSYKYGSYSLYDLDKPAKGWITVTDYDVSNDEELPTPELRQEIKGADKYGRLLPGVTSEIIRYSYDTDTQKWELSNKEKISWINNKLYCSETDSEKRYFVYEQRDKARYSVIFDQNTQSYWMQASVYGYDYDRWTYTQYDLNNEVMVEYVYYGSRKNKFADSKIPTFEMTKNGKKSTPEHVILPTFNFVYHITTYNEFKCDKNGVITFFGEKDEGKNFYNKYKTWQHNNNGYVMTQFGHDDNNGYYKSEEVNYTKGATENVFDTYSYWYNGKESELTNRKRLVIRNDERQTSYDYDLETNTFLPPTYDISNKIVNDEKTGMSYEIKQSVDNAGNVSFSSIKGNYTGPDKKKNVRSYYSWNNKTKRIELQDSVISYETDIVIPYKVLPFPDANYNDEGDKLISAIYKEQKKNKKFYNSKEYSFDKNEQKVVLANQTIYEAKKTGENTYFFHKYIMDKWDRIEYDYKFTIDVNDKQQVTHYVCDISNLIREITTKYEVSYTINEHDQMTAYEVKTTDSQTVSTSLDLFKFKKVSMDPSSIEQVKGDEKLCVNGRHISAGSDALIMVYDMGGRKVASAKGNLTLPAAGLYIVKSGSFSMKVNCR